MKSTPISLIIIIIVVVAGVIAVLVLSPTQKGREPFSADKKQEGGIKNSNNQQKPMEEKLKLTSTAFEHEGSIPSKYSCDGEEINPSLKIEGVTENAKSLVLIMDDPDVPQSIMPEGIFDHWVRFNIPPETNEIAEDEEPEGVSGANTAGKLGYYPPCPPDAEHRYIFKLYALDTELNLEEGATKEKVEKIMEGHIIDKTELIGRYER